MKNNKGITLVALVVTIIILIILAGISINLVLGDNGIITIAKKAKENTELAKIEEEKELNELYAQLETEGSNSSNLPYDSIAKLTEFKKKIAEAITNEGVNTSADATAEMMVANIAKILQTRTSNATATEENIDEGKTAYANGILLTGNKKENNDFTIRVKLRLNFKNSASTTDFQVAEPIYEIKYENGVLEKKLILGSTSVDCTYNSSQGNGKPYSNIGISSIEIIK